MAINDAEVAAVIARIPKGKVASYSGVGRAMKNPTTGRVVGRILFTSGREMEWWRVLAKSGTLSIGKLDPAKAKIQRELLEKEGVEFSGDRVLARFFCDDDLLPD